MRPPSVDSLVQEQNEDQPEPQALDEHLLTSDPAPYTLAVQAPESCSNILAIERSVPGTPTPKQFRKTPVPSPITVHTYQSLSLHKASASVPEITLRPHPPRHASLSAAHRTAPFSLRPLVKPQSNTSWSDRPHQRYFSVDSSPSTHGSRSGIPRAGGRRHRRAGTDTRLRTPSPMSNTRLKPPITLEFDGVQRTISNESLSTDTSQPLKSPSRIGAFFGWKSASPQKTGTESPTTTFSERSVSPAASPAQKGKPLPSVPGQGRLVPSGLDIQKANASTSRFPNSPRTPMIMAQQDMSNHVQELEQELAQVSAELAGSIRREMDLEDEIERLKMDHSVAPSEMSRRGSDYFSDSGAGSVRYPISDPDAKIQEEERLRRKAEQDRAQIKLDMAAKTQTELSKRRDLEELVQRLEGELERQSNEGSEKKDKRVEELEAQLEENRRRLNQEKEARANFEDLYTALQSELSSGRRHLGGRGFGSIAEEGDDYNSGLSRSGSLARSGSKRAGSLNRSGSVKGRQRSGSGSAPVTAEGMQEVEEQRDALHKALKLLISRFDKQQKEHERHIKQLTRTKRLADKLNLTPGKSGYHRDVSVLKEEVATLRKRTEDALEQKWQYEKSLGGIKMDLDRAEHETRGLRDILKEHDILAPSPQTMQTATFGAPDRASKPILSIAEEEREQARRLAAQIRKQAENMQRSGSNPGNVKEMQQAASRMDQLYQQFDSQIKTNTALHNRLSAAVEKGEREQEMSTKQIQEMQKKLAGMEDSLLAAQQHSENTLNKHESQVRSIEESTSPRLHRFTLEVNDMSKLSPASPNVMRRSTLGGKKKVQDVSLLDASRTSMLEKKVRELERSLRDAEDDMQHVVQRVNKSQLEVAELTNERDAAFTQMRKLQKQLVSETERAEAMLGGRKPVARGYDSGSDYGD